MPLRNIFHEGGCEITLEEPLTSGQMAVLRLLVRGKSNKIIAYELE